MRILIVDHIGSFSLAARLVKLTHGTHQIMTLGRVTDALNWERLRAFDPDVVLCEWGDANAATLSHRLRELPRRVPLVVRLHGYESHDWFVRRVDWTAVDRLVTVSPWFRRLMAGKVGDRVRVICIPNGVDLSRFEPAMAVSRDLSQVAWLGQLNQKKGPALLRCVAASIPERVFNVAGPYQCENTTRILFDGPDNLRLRGTVDPTEFLPGQGWILSTSVTESFSYAVAEGMASGLTPLVHDWPGARELWPAECCWRSIDELRAIEPKDPEWCRQWVADRYPVERQIVSFLAVLEEVAG